VVIWGVGIEEALAEMGVVKVADEGGKGRARENRYGKGRAEER
jgi:hypothetical protein